MTGFRWIMGMILSVLSLVNACVDGQDNVITVDSLDQEYDELPVKVKNVKILVYDIFYKPSCHRGRVNIVLPGYFHITSGEVQTSRDFDLFKSSHVKATIVLNDRELCTNGHSSFFLVPGRFCHFEMTSFVPHDICRLLQKKGIHTLHELQENIHFNTTLELPPSPSFLGIKLLDLLNGDYRVKISVHSEGAKIVEFAIPSEFKPMQIGL